eukprot:GFUD01086513.1.p1 GENE.GFUD01086513.1~~GFUD01086513.1.p1  ORF type:complete len:335 (-),score=42.88 GFUD01086513.1:127-1044(-)
MRAGSACSSRCNYATGKWEEGACQSYHRPSNNQLTCRTVSGKYCQFPFNYDGDTFNTCISKNSTKPWCPAVSYCPNCMPNENEAAVQETCSPDNEQRCTKISPACELFCESPQTGQTECSCSCSGGSNLGAEIPPLNGNCHDESGPCYNPTVCSSENHDWSFSSVEFHEIDYSREDNTTSITATTPPITSGPKKNPTEQQVEADNIRLQTQEYIEMGKIYNICLGRIDDLYDMNYMLQERVESLTVELANANSNFALMWKDVHKLIETAEVPKDIQSDDQDIDAGDMETGDTKSLIFLTGSRSKN